MSDTQEPNVVTCVVRRKVSLAGGRPAGAGDIVDVDLDVPANARLLRAGSIAEYSGPAPGEEPTLEERAAALKKLNKPDLVELATAAGFDDADSLTKAQIVEALTAPPTHTAPEGDTP